MDGLVERTQKALENESNMLKSKIDDKCRLLDKSLSDQMHLIRMVVDEKAQ
jgi:hypothetical protein